MKLNIEVNEKERKFWKVITEVLDATTTLLFIYSVTFLLIVKVIQLSDYFHYGKYDGSTSPFLPIVVIYIVLYGTYLFLRFKPKK